MSGPTIDCPLPQAQFPPGAATAGRVQRRFAFRKPEWASSLAGSLHFLLSLVLAILLVQGLAGSPALAREPAPARQGLEEVALDELPVQVATTLALIRAGGPFPYRKDGTVFGNRERLLPPRPRGHYTEYTVPTPRARTRGARRIVAAGEPTRTDELYYTDDHYQSFRRIRVPG